MKEILFAGAGGQGVLTSGDILLNLAVDQGYQATWTPEYGSAMRGGDANCTVKISDSMIYNPMREEPDILLAMNQSSFDKYIDSVKKGGVLITNKELVDLSENTRDDIEILEIAVMEMTGKINHPKGANIIMAALIIRELGFDEEDGIKAMVDMFRADGKERFEEANIEAFKLGYSL